MKTFPQRCSSVAIACLPILAFVGFGASASASLLLNPGFEAVPDGSTGQALLPSDYFNAGNIGLGADTYSNDGSYGLSPGAYGNFSGATAQEAIRFVAGAERPGSFNEAFGQVLSVPLAPNTSYTFTAYVRERLEGGFVGGGYQLMLSPGTGMGAFEDPLAVSLGFLDPTTGIDAWEFRSLTFVTPANAGALSSFILAPYSAGAGEAYIGIDNLSLELAQAVPEPTSCALLGLGLTTLGGVQLRRQRKTQSLAA